MLLAAADRIGELRHRRRLRKLERQRAEREAGATTPPVLPDRRQAAKVRRDGFLSDFPKLPPPEQH